MNRRGFFKGATGAAIAGPEALRKVADARPPYPPPPHIYNINPTKDAPLNKILDDPLRLAKEAFRDQVRKQRQILEAQMELKIQAIQRQKSTSDAYKIHMITKLNAERSEIWARAEELVESSW